MLPEGFSRIFVVSCPIGGSEKREKPPVKIATKKLQLQLQWGATIKKRKHRGRGGVRGTHSLIYSGTEFRLNVALNFGGNSASKVYLELFFFGQTRAGGDRAAKSVAPSVLSGRSCISSRRVSRVFPLLHLFSAGVRGGAAERSARRARGHLFHPNISPRALPVYFRAT